jgi:toxin HigB-1
MIETIRHKGLKRLLEHDDPSGVNPEHADKLRDILATLHAAPTVAHMDLPGFRLHPLKGQMKGFWAVTVRANWPVIFASTVTRRMSIISITTKPKFRNSKKGKLKDRWSLGTPAAGFY